MLIAGPNLTIDRTMTIARLRPGEVLRFDAVVVTAGGKGVNVARVARALGAPALLVGLTPGHTGTAAAAMLADEGVALRAVPAPGELRSTAVVLEPDGRVTVFNEPGPPVGPDDWARYEAAIVDELAGARVLACSGSVPPGAPPDAYARLVERARAAGMATIVDAAPAQLEAALRLRPDVVVPNLAEAEELLHGRADETVEAGDLRVVRERAGAAAAGLVARGATRAVVTAGAAGAAVADGEQRSWHPAPSLLVRNPIGAGDSFVGGLGVALERGEPFRRAVVLALAAAAASVESDLAGGVDPVRVGELAGEAATLG